MPGPSATGLRIDRTLSATPHRVWPALTDPAALAAWFWPAEYDPRVICDLQPGGGWRIEAAGGPAVGLAVACEYAVVRAPHTLVFDWRWQGEDERTTVHIDLTPAGEDGAQTTLTLRHNGFADESSRDNHVLGWTDCLDRLDRWLR